MDRLAEIKSAYWEGTGPVEPQDVRWLLEEVGHLRDELKSLQFIHDEYRKEAVSRLEYERAENARLRGACVPTTAEEPPCLCGGQRIVGSGPRLDIVCPACDAPRLQGVTDRLMDGRVAR